MERFSGKVVIVTGGASGIGEGAVARFAAEGAYVMIADVNEPANAPDGTRFFKTDVTSEANVNAMVEAAVSEWGKLDVIVNNAGIGALGTTPDTELAMWEKIFAVNSTGVFLCCHAAIPHLKKTRGSIVNTASISGLFGDYALAAYNASKGAVVNYTRALALDCAEYGVRANSICPGLVDTPMAAQSMADANTTEHWFGLIPLGRAGSPADMAGAIAFLASDDAAYITGVNLPVDGGITCHTGQPNFPKRQMLGAGRRG